MRGCNCELQFLMAPNTITKERPASLRKPNLTFFVSNEEIGINQKIQLRQGNELPEDEIKPIMTAIKTIFHHALFSCEMDSKENDLPESNGMPNGGATDKFELHDSNLRAIIHRLSEEIISNNELCTATQEAALGLLDLVCSYSWEAKVVLVLAAFAMIYGQFWADAERRTSSTLEQSECWFLKPQCLFSEIDSRSLRVQSLKNLVRVILDVADRMVELKELTKKNEIQFDGLNTNALQSGVYLIFTSVYTCLSSNMDLVIMDFEHPLLIPEIQEMEECYHKLAKVHDYLSQLYKQEQEYLDIEIWFNKQDQNAVQLISMLYPTNWTQCLGLGCKKVNLNCLNGKTVAFFISNFDVNMKDFTFLETTCNEIKKKENFEIVWIPTVDQCTEWNSDNQTKFDFIAASMPWYRLCDLPSIKWAFLRYIQQKWHFQRKPILIILGDHCRVTNTNALPIVEIFGPEAFPFTIHLEEEMLWKKYAKPIWQLLQELHQNLQESVKGKVVCFYGSHKNCLVTELGELLTDIKHQFKTKFKMEIVYIGTNRAEAKLGSSSELKTQTWELDKINKFWRRLTYLYHKRMTNCKRSKVEPLKDSIMKELITISTYDYNEYGWIIMFGGSSEEMVTCSGLQLSKFKNSFDSLVSSIHGPVDFVKLLNDNIPGSHTKEQCINISVQATATNTYKRRSCLVCRRPMKKYFLRSSS